MVGLTLILFTCITLAVGKLQIFDIGAPGVTGGDIIAGLLIATFKVSLVALIFMHLKEEKPLIFKFLLFTMIFVLGLFVLTYLTHSDPQIWDGFRKSVLFQ